MSVATTQPATSGNTAGILWMVSATILYVLMVISVRFLGTDMPTSQSAFLRFAIGMVLMLPMIPGMLRGGFPADTKSLFFWRGLIHTVGVIFWFYAMVRLPVAEVTAIGYLTPILMTVGAAVMFGEILTGGRLISLVVALGGALVVLRPGVREIEPAHLAQVASAVCFAISFLLAKRLAMRAGSVLITFMMAVSITVLLAPLAIVNWTPVSVEEFAWIALSAVFATAANYCHMKSYSLAPLMVTQPVIFLQIFWATALGYVLFGEAMDPWTITGGLSIVAATVFATLIEKRAKPVSG